MPDGQVYPCSFRHWNRASQNSLTAVDVAVLRELYKMSMLKWKVTVREVSEPGKNPAWIRLRATLLFVQSQYWKWHRKAPDIELLEIHGNHNNESPTGKLDHHDSVESYRRRTLGTINSGAAFGFGAILQHLGRQWNGNTGCSLGFNVKIDFQCIVQDILLPVVLSWSLFMSIAISDVVWLFRRDMVRGKRWRVWSE